MTPDLGVSPHQSVKIACPSTSLKMFAGIVTRVINKYKITKTLLQIPPTPKTYLPPDLGHSSERLSVRANTVGFFQACVEAIGLHELNQLPPSPHPAATLLKHMKVHGIAIKLQRGMTTQEIIRSILYGAHSSATKETIFVRTELTEQARAGHTALFPLRAVRHLSRLWLSSLSAIPQQGRKPRLVYDFSCSGLNKSVTQVSHKEAMRFVKYLYRVIDCILAAPPKLVPTFLNKVNLVDSYMRIWVRLEDIPSMVFLVPKFTLEEDQLVGFHLSITMGYV